MITKDQIFENIDQYSAKELVNYIKQGIVTFPELANPRNTYGEFKPKVRRKVEDLLKNAEPNDWELALSQNTIEGFQTYLNNYPEGAHRNEARTRKKSLEEQILREQSERKKKEQEIRLQEAKAAAQGEWDKVKKSNKQAIEAYLREHPNSPFLQDAQYLLDDFENVDYRSYGMESLKENINKIESREEKPHPYILEEIENALKNGWIDIDEILDEVEVNHNFLNAWVLNELVKQHFFSYRDLEDLGIMKVFIQKLARNTQKIEFKVPQAFDKITRKSTEVYFWGIPSSGKTCVLGAILNVMNNGKIARTMFKDSNCQGFDYLNRLPLCFNNQVSVLPAGTDTTATYEMGFDLVDYDERVHPITCIDFAGEIMRCIYKVLNGQALTWQQTKAFDVLNNVLVDKKTENRKMHFFVVEYGAEERRYEDLPQRNYLDAVVQYIDKHDIFKTSTDAIFLIITKVDKVKGRSREEKTSRLSAYIEEQYGGFINGLEDICKKYQINGGKIPKIPFSLGNVCFQDYCMFKDAYASRIVDIILSRSYRYKVGNVGLINSIFRG